VRSVFTGAVSVALSGDILNAPDSEAQVCAALHYHMYVLFYLIRYRVALFVLVLDALRQAHLNPLFGSDAVAVDFGLGRI
jgi:hypothetical protein